MLPVLCPRKVRADALQGAPPSHGAVAVDQEVIADVGPTTILDVPAADLGHLGAGRVAVHPIGLRRAGMDDDFGNVAHGVTFSPEKSAV
ncbi:hypothetical protein [Salipiger mucosus]|uniref:hypothetical protein n=1 Tax=Salipiger mucosus TaxID=263378 RepID=UPI001FE06459|nr:hypothetical protein [Salipiger mucosus]